MPRQLGSLCLALIAICLLSELDIQTSSGQIFQRFRNRRQNRATPTQPNSNRQRVSPTPQVTPTPASPRPSQSGSQRSSPSSNARPTARPGTLDVSKYGPSILIRPGQEDRLSTPSSAVQQVSGQASVSAPDGPATGVVPAVGQESVRENKNASTTRIAQKPPVETARGDTLQNVTRQSVRPSLGIEVLETKSGVQGVSVTGFREDSRADEAGLKEGDIIVAIDNQPTPNIPAVAAILDRRKVGQTVQTRVLRGQSIQVVNIPLLGPAAQSAPPETQPPRRKKSATPPMGIQSSRVENPFAEPTPNVPRPELAPAAADAPVPLGVSVRPLEDARGVTIAELKPNSPASAAGLKVGDRIVSVDGRLTAGVDAFKQEIQSRRRGDSLSLGLVRGEKMMRTTVTLDTPQPVSPLASTGTKSTKDGSLLRGIGNVLGGVFGGAESDDKKPGGGTAERSAASKQKREDKSQQDGMALEDDEGVKPVGFDDEIANQLKKLVGDPPSLKELGIPANQKSPVEPGVATNLRKSDSTAAELREQIRQLQERLKEVEKADQD